MEILLDDISPDNDYSEILVDANGEWILRTEEGVLVPISDEAAELLVEKWQEESDGWIH